MNIISSLIFIVLSGLFYHKRDKYKVFHHEIFILCWTAYIMLVIKGWYTANILWLVPSIICLCALFFNSYISSLGGKRSIKVWMIVTNIFFLTTVFLQ